MIDFKQLQEEVNPILDRAFTDSQERFFRGSPMREMLEYHFLSGGKRIRPLLTFGAARAYGIKKGMDPGPLLLSCAPYALAVELLHNATLIHDDIQDGDRARRGKETLWVKYSPAQAINCGDAWFFVPQLLVQEATYPDELKLSLLGLLQEKTLAVIEGQSQEFAMKERFAQGEDIGVGQYLAMVEGKTSALFSMPLLGGARIAGAGQLEQKALEQSGLHLGHAFQIQDDLLDLWGDKGRGLSGSDIAEGKLSYPLVLLLQKLGRASEARKRVEEIVCAPREETSAEDISFVISLMEREGVKEQARRDFLRHLQEARTAVFWEDVVGFLASWLEEKVQGF
jgi:geranylgeranyl diphosphate synthase, type I